MDADSRQARRGRLRQSPRLGAFGTTVVAFFLAEMGDKTQVATVMLAARYHAWFAVPLRVVHIVSAVIFAALGLAALIWN